MVMVPLGLVPWPQIQKHWPSGLMLAPLLHNLTQLSQKYANPSPGWLAMVILNFLMFAVAIWAMYKVLRPVSEWTGNALAFLIIIAAPLAMLGVRLARVLIRLYHVTFGCTGDPQPVKPQSKWTFCFSVAGLFSPAALPYFLYPLSCCLLE
jgi:hypothetical protein